MDVPKDVMREEGFSEEKIAAQAFTNLYGPVGCENCKDGVIHKDVWGYYFEVVRSTQATAANYHGGRHSI